jgi:hypothetical protein
MGEDKLKYGCPFRRKYLFSDSIIKAKLNTDLFLWDKSKSDYFSEILPFLTKFDVRLRLLISENASPFSEITFNKT